MLKMKAIFMIATFISLLVCCRSSVSQMKSLEGSSPEYQKYIKKEFAQGEVLYKKYCAPCHGIFGPGNTDAPNFSQIELHNYNAAFIKGDRDNHAVAQGLDDDSFGKILTFLTYRKTDVVPAK